jgi:hypothetical protein
MYYKLRTETYQKSMNYTNLYNCFSYHSTVSIATLALDCVCATLNTQSIILSNLFKVKYYVIYLCYVLFGGGGKHCHPTQGC